MVSRYAIMDGDKVINVALAEADFAAEMGWVEVPPSVGPGFIRVGSEFQPAPPDLVAMAEEVRAERDRRLREEVDPIVSNPLRWADMTPEQQQAWADYRQALLGVPQQPGFPQNVEWPIGP